jgi:cytochrome c-type biogenesis protein CcmH/NrfF
MTVKFLSPFFALNQNFSLGPYEQKQFAINLNRDDFKNLLAGFYTLVAQVNMNGSNASVEGSIDFSKQNILNVSENTYGFLITTDVIQKVNKGNVIADSQTTLKKDIISRIFTTFSQTPDSADREGFFVTYTWNNQIQPGDTLTITARTNWLLPLFIILFIVAIVILVTQYSKTSLNLRKSVSYMRAKGGEFALRVTVVVTARKFVERVTVFDRLPFVAKLYEKFGAEKPTKIDEKNRRLEWHFDRLAAGETRILSYIIYSKVGVLGRFALPTARAVYQREGKVHESESNQAFLVTEQSKSKED